MIIESSNYLEIPITECVIMFMRVISYSRECHPMQKPASPKTFTNVLKYPHLKIPTSTAEIPSITARTGKLVNDIRTHRLWYSVFNIKKRSYTKIISKNHPEVNTRKCTF